MLNTGRSLVTVCCIGREQTSHNSLKKSKRRNKVHLQLHPVMHRSCDECYCFSYRSTSESLKFLLQNSVIFYNSHWWRQHASISCRKNILKLLSCVRKLIPCVKKLALKILTGQIFSLSGNFGGDGGINFIFSINLNFATNLGDNFRNKV